MGPCVRIKHHQLIAPVHASSGVGLSVRLGQAPVLPAGNSAQAQAAKNCAINATIGQITDGRNGALPLPAMVEPVGGLPAEQIVLYTTTSGNPQLRALWAERLRSQECGSISNPIVTQGLTHGLSIVADLFSDSTSTVFLPESRMETTNTFLARAETPRFKRIDPFGGKAWTRRHRSSAAIRAKRCHFGP